MSYLLQQSFSSWPNSKPCTPYSGCKSARSSPHRCNLARPCLITAPADELLTGARARGASGVHRRGRGSTGHSAQRRHPAPRGATAYPSPSTRPRAPLAQPAQACRHNPAPPPTPRPPRSPPRCAAATAIAFTCQLQLTRGVSHGGPRLPVLRLTTAGPIHAAQDCHCDR